jgi:hypothetical protein
MVKRVFRLVTRLTASGAAVAAVILVLGGGFCLWQGSCSVAGFADTVISLSLVAAAVGGLLAMGGGLFAGSANYQIARSAGRATTADRTQQDVRASAGRLSCTLLLAVGGVEAAAIGLILKTLAGPTFAG